MGNTSFDLGRIGVWTGALDGVSSKDAQRAAAVLEPDARKVPEGAWKELGAAIGASSTK
jgi:hypothetical protein